MDANSDKYIANEIEEALRNLSCKLYTAKKAGLQIHLTANEFGQTVAAKVSREYDYDISPQVDEEDE